MHKKSGPRTARGRAAVHNALTHGLRTADILMPGELRADWHNFHDRVVDELAPDSPILCELASKIATILWRLRRVPRAEAALVVPGAVLAPGQIAPEGMEYLRELTLDVYLTQPGDGDLEPAEADRQLAERKRAWLAAHPEHQRAAPTPNPGSDPITCLMTPAHTPLEQIVRYEAHLYRQLYQALAYYNAHRRASAVVSAINARADLKTAEQFPELDSER